jgi:hypothetical protein
MHEGSNGSLGGVVADKGSGIPLSKQWITGTGGFETPAYRLFCP